VDEEKTMLHVTETIPEALAAATDALATALRASPLLEEYAAAEEALAADATATTLLEQFSAAQRTLQARQADGSITQFDLNTVRTLQRELEMSAPIADYITAQQEALEQLSEVNDDLSQLLGMNFAQLARRSSCC
jgi:cell fate (sporulation/competence/biofilm development) regulator YlbF (YheA/YmcA/DUF963 family)